MAKSSNRKRGHVSAFFFFFCLRVWYLHANKPCISVPSAVPPLLRRSGQKVLGPLIAAWSIFEVLHLEIFGKATCETYEKARRERLSKMFKQT